MRDVFAGAERVRPETRRGPPVARHAVVAVTDAANGERLELLTIERALTWQGFAAAAGEAGLPELSVPRTITPVCEIPVLGTGRTGDIGVAALAAVSCREARSTEDVAVQWRRTESAYAPTEPPAHLL